MTAPTPRPETIGLIGIGLLGTAIAERLLSAGFIVIGYDLASARRDAFRHLGGRVAEQAAAVFTDCRRIVLSLPTHHEAATVLRSAGPSLQPGSIILDTTTGEPTVAEQLARELAGRGVDYLDTTVSGSSAQMRGGTAVLIVGGAQRAFAECGDILQRLGAQTFYTGAPGSAARMKLVTNLVLGLNRVALAEGLALARAVGLDPEQALAVMRSGPAYSRMMDTKGGKMLRGDFSPEARLSQHLKDVRLILAQGHAAGLPMPMSRAHCAVLEQAEAAGLGALDNSAVIQVLSTPSAAPNAKP